MDTEKYIEYLRNKIEQLQNENTQLKIKIDRLEREEPIHYQRYWPAPPEPIPAWYYTITC